MLSLFLHLPCCFCVSVYLYISFFISPLTYSSLFSLPLSLLYSVSFCHFSPFHASLSIFLFVLLSLLLFLYCVSSSLSPSFLLQLSLYSSLTSACPSPLVFFQTFLLHLIHSPHLLVPFRADLTAQFLSASIFYLSAYIRLSLSFLSLIFPLFLFSVLPAPLNSHHAPHFVVLYHPVHIYCLFASQGIESPVL